MLLSILYLYFATFIDSAYIYLIKGRDNDIIDIAYNLISELSNIYGFSVYI
jgi:hypothetical protein